MTVRRGLLALALLAGLARDAGATTGATQDQDMRGFKFYGLPLVPDRSTGAATLRFVTPGAGYLKASAQDGTITSSATIPYADITGGPATTAITATTGDVVSNGPGSVPATIQANVVSNAKIRQGVGVSVIGVTGSSTANVGDIAATGGSQFLGTNAAGTTLSFTSSIPLTSMGTTTVANVAALEALAGSGYRNGSRVNVESLQREFVYHASSSVTVDHITVASVTGVGGARWISDAIPWLMYWNTTTWFVDPANSSAVASDQNAGTTSGAPLRSFAELGRRLYGAQLVSGTITVTLMSDTPQSDPLIIRGVSTTGFTFFSIIGTPTTVVSGRTISSPRMPSVTANDHFEITDSSGISGFVQNNLLHKTNGTQAWFWGYKDLGSNKLQISMPMTTGGGAATLANGDTYEVLDPPDFADLIIEPISSGGFVFYDVQKVRVLGSTNVGVPAPGGPSVWDRCIMQGAGATIFGHGIDSVSLQNVMAPATAGGTNLLGRWGATGGLYAGNGTTTQVFFSEGYTLGGSNLPMTLGGAQMVVTHDARFEKLQVMLYDWTGTAPGVSVTHRSTALITGLGGERNTGPLVGVDTFSQAVATDSFASWNSAITTNANPYSVGPNLFTASSLGVGTNMLATEAMGIIDYSASWAGDLSGKAIDPSVVAIHETSGPTKLTIGAISNGQILQRSGSTIIGVAGGTVTSVGATLPLTSTGGATPTIALQFDNSTLTLSGGNALQRAALTGDINAAAGSNVTTLATVGGGAGSCTYCSVTFDAKGRETAYSSGTAPVLTVAGTAGRISSVGTTAITLDLIATAVTPTSYTYGSFTVDSFGRLTAASNGATPAPVGATYITQTADATLTNEQALSSLSDGMMTKTAGGIVGTFVSGSTRVPFGSGTAGALTDSGNMTFNGQSMGFGSLQDLQVYNDSTNATAFAGLHTATDPTFTNQFSFGMTGTNWSTGALAANAGLVQLVSGAAPIIVSNYGGGKISFTTGSGHVERMSIATAGVSVTNLTNGLSRTNGAGLLSTEVMPAANRVLAANGAGTDFASDAEIMLDSTFTDSLMISQDGAIIWRDKTGLSMIGATNFAEVAGFFSGGVFSLKARQGGVTAIPAMVVNADTATLTLAGAEVRSSTLTGGGFVYTPPGSNGELLNTTPTAEFNYYVEVSTGAVAALNSADQYIATSATGFFGGTALEYPVGKTLPTFGRIEACLVGANTINTGEISVCASVNGSTGINLTFDSTSTGCKRTSLSNFGGAATDKVGVTLCQSSGIGGRNTATLSGTFRLAIKSRWQGFTTF